MTEEPNREQTLRNHVITTPIETMVSGTVKSRLNVCNSLSSASLRSVIGVSRVGVRKRSFSIFLFLLQEVRLDISREEGGEEKMVTLCRFGSIP